MKKLGFVLLVFLILISFAACSSEKKITAAVNDRTSEYHYSDDPIAEIAEDVASLEQDLKAKTSVLGIVVMVLVFVILFMVNHNDSNISDQETRIGKLEKQLKKEQKKEHNED